MTAGQLKILLDSLVGPEDRQFQVRFAERRTRRVLGIYRRSTRMITIIRKNNVGPFDVIATGLHELAHHLTWERAQFEYHVGTNRKARWRRHGENFLGNLYELSLVFNARYCTRLKGGMRCDRRRPAQSPFYMTPEEVLLMAIFEPRQAKTFMRAYPFDLEESNNAGSSREVSQT